ncbi:hypothetical protein LTR17_009136 [Elasticomyces elasticus]|nr:hypothetical protein LTR17_009136 [Elasticomyces elasticus]
MSSSLESEDDSLPRVTGRPNVENESTAAKVKELLGVTKSIKHVFLWKDFVAHSTELYKSNATGKQWDRGWGLIDPILWEPWAKELSQGRLLRNQTEELAFDTSQWALLKRHEQRGREASKKAKKKTRVAAPAGDNAAPELDPSMVGEVEDSALADSVRSDAIPELDPGMDPGAGHAIQVANPHYDPVRDSYS